MDKRKAFIRATSGMQEDSAAQDREAGLYADIELVRRSLNQLTDHGSQHCLDCQKHRQDGMDALDRLERGMRWMERRDG